MQRDAGPAAARPPAEVYEDCFAPALFRSWGPRVTRAAGVAPGGSVLDVGCGTGALTEAAAAAAAPGGRVVGLDPNPEMLAVARRKRLPVEWIEGRAEALPFPDSSFDAVVSQFAMMFFDDRAAALREMMRTLRPGGRLVVAVFDAVERSPGYAALARLLDRLFGREIGDALRAPFALGDAGRLERLAREAGLAGARVSAREGEARFPSPAALVSMERACVWTLGGLLDDAQFARLAEEAERELAPFVDRDGRVVLAMPALFLEAARR